jgi:hypothetical protein
VAAVAGVQEEPAVVVRQRDAVVGLESRDLVLGRRRGQLHDSAVARREDACSQVRHAGTGAGLSDSLMRIQATGVAGTPASLT